MGEQHVAESPFPQAKCSPAEASLEREEKAVPTPKQAGDGPRCTNCGLRHGKGLPVWPDAAGIFCQEKEQGWLESLFCVITLGLSCGWFFIIVGIEAGLVVHALLFRSLVTGTLAAVLFSSMWWPLDNRYPWRAFVNCYLFRAWRRYFSYEVIVEEPLKPGRRHILAQMPHGIVPLAQMLSASVVPVAFPGAGPMAAVAADIVLRIPLVRSLYGWLGTRTANRRTIHEMFEDGVQVAVVVGGIAEMFLVNDAEERVYLSGRKSFVRLAVQEGADIVPMFFYGQSRLFDLVRGETCGWLQRISRRMKASIIFYYGRFWLTVPYRRPLRTVVGRPIRVEQSDDPAPDYVAALHQELVRRTCDLYERHRPPWEKRPLVIC